MLATSGERHNGDTTSAFYANNDAGSYNTRYLKSIRNKERFQELHFYAAPRDKIDELFPKQPGKGSLDTTRAFRSSAVNLKEWRNMLELDQMLAIEATGDEGLDENGGHDVVAEQTAEVTVAPPPAAKIAKTEDKRTEVEPLDR